MTSRKRQAHQSTKGIGHVQLSQPRVTEPQGRVASTSEEPLRTGLPWRERAGVSQALAAELLGVSRQYLWAMANRDELQVVRLGRRVIVPVSEILRLVGEDDRPSSPDDVKPAS